MLLSSNRDIGLFAVIFFVFWALAGERRRRPRLWFLLAASCLLYALTSLEYLLLLLGFSVANYFTVLRIQDTTGRARKSWCGLAVVVSLAVLAVFKYLDFFGQSLQALLTGFGAGTKVPLANLVLPLGISFYTFSNLAYALDVYRGKYPAARSPRDYALYLVFFPKLASGPIARPDQFLPQLETDPVYSHEQTVRGLYRIFFGLFKKRIVADSLAYYLVNSAFSDPGKTSLPLAWLAMWGYSIQIYCDFSGYTDMAIGAAQMLGFRLPENFDRPYLARNPQEFWRRWHITLSNWLRDYLYISLGGSRHGKTRTFLALFLTMLLGGLWHGAAWTFVFWGAFHGLLLILHRLQQEIRPAPTEPGRLRRLAEIVVTFNLISLAWVFFRAPDLATATGLISRLFLGDFSLAGVSARVLLLLALGVALHTTVKWRDRLGDLFVRLHPALQGATLMIAIAFFDVMSNVSQPFIYYTF